MTGTKAGAREGHRLMRVSNTQTYGVEPTFAICTCGWETDPGSQEETARTFDAHTVEMGGGLVPAPWREP